MRRSRVALSLALLVLAAAPAAAQQARAPAGGMYVNGRFYKGGQFIPSGAGGGIGMFDGGGAVDPIYAPDLAASRRKARTKARTAARTEARTTARASEGGVAAAGTRADQDGVARSRLQTAKNLIKMGKDGEAREWLERIGELEASLATAAEAQRLRAEIDRRIGPQRRPSPPGGGAATEPRPATARSSPPARATPRYFAQVDAPGPFRHGQLKGPVGVLGSPDDPKPIGDARDSGSFEDGQAAWSLIIRGIAVPGRWIIVDREFLPAG
jgi:hypothetical protein